MVVVLMCGLAGAGKTTYARSLEAAGYARLSIDEYIHARYGMYGVDYEPSAWDTYQQEADAAIQQELGALLAAGRDVVVDLSFWSRAMRDEWKRLVEDHGARWELVYIQVDPALLADRIAARSRTCGANAFPVPPEMLARFIAGFEPPSGEGETIIPSTWRPNDG